MRVAIMMLAAAAVASATPAVAQTMRNGSVTMVRTGWNADSFALVTAEPIANPARCVSPDGYLSAKNLPGYQTYYAAALTALSAHLPVVVVVHNTECANDRPKLIGINLSPG